jgi:hypothetical protein
VNQDEARELLRTIDPSAAQKLVIGVAEELDGLAAQVWAFGLAEGARRALAIVAQMGAELAVGACLLYESERWYAGAALVRQLIEVEYLLFLFATEPSEAQRWLTASPDDVRRMFSPKNMRERSKGRFRASEYDVHCEVGGHPRLRGHVLLREHLTPLQHDPLDLFDPGVQWVDLAQHVERMWGHYVVAVEIHSPTNVYPDRFDRVNAQIAAWRESDPRAGRL